MRTMRRAMVTAAGLALLAAGPVLAAGEGAGREEALVTVEQATAKHLDVLTGLLSEVPEQARASLEKAIVMSRRGHDAALQALSTARREAARFEAARGAGPADAGAAPDLRGLERARERVAAGFEKSAGTLGALLEKVPEQAVDRIGDALERVGEHRQVALENLDRLIAGLRPERAALDRPDRPERSDRPERPDRPQIPERPEAPERPALPDRPERPEPPAPVN